MTTVSKQDSLREEFTLTIATVIITAGLYWTMFEAGMGLIVVCLPSHYVLAQTLWKSWFSEETEEGDGNEFTVSNRGSEQQRVEMSESQRPLEHPAKRGSYLTRADTQTTSSTSSSFA